MEEEVWSVVRVEIGYKHTYTVHTLTCTQPCKIEDLDAMYCTFREDGD